MKCIHGVRIDNPCDQCENENERPPSAPESTLKAKYPSDELMLSWRPRGCACSICFTAAVRKALDWQREQDALICLGHVDELPRSPDSFDVGFNAGCENCAIAIRHQAPNEEAK